MPPRREEIEVDIAALALRFAAVAFDHTATE
jgi:hypothetical protein